MLLEPVFSKCWRCWTTVMSQSFGGWKREERQKWHFCPVIDPFISFSRSQLWDNKWGRLTNLPGWQVGWLLICLSLFLMIFYSFNSFKWLMMSPYIYANNALRKIRVRVFRGASSQPKLSAEGRWAELLLSRASISFSIGEALQSVQAD